MKKISLVMVAAMLLFTGSIFANDVKGSDPANNGISAQISKILNINDFSEEDTDMSAQVRFTINNQDEIVVLSVDTDNDRFEAFVKNRLNYRKIKATDLEEGELFTVSVRVAS